MSVVIENDFQNTLHPDCKPRENVDALTPQEIIDIIRDAGCTGMGGAGFPTHVKISSAVGKADTIIINGAECEPYITADHRLMLEHGEKIIGGVRFIMKALQLDHAYIGIENNKMDAVAHLRELLGDAKAVTVKDLRTRYPQGAEKQLIQAITGREVPPGKLPADVGCCVFNAATTAADIVNLYSESQLADIFYLYGELKNARRIASAIVRRRGISPILTTGNLQESVTGLFHKEREKKDMARLFQALRIEVNQEMRALGDLLKSSVELLKPGGRLVVITYHSLEDRLVKNLIRSGNIEGKVTQDFYGRTQVPLEAVNTKVILPSEEEIAANPRSRSAKLRIAKKK